MSYEQMPELGELLTDEYMDSQMIMPVGNVTLSRPDRLSLTRGLPVKPPTAASLRNRPPVGGQVDLSYLGSERAWAEVQEINEANTDMVTPFSRSFVHVAIMWPFRGKSTRSDSGLPKGAQGREEVSRVRNILACLYPAVVAGTRRFENVKFMMISYGQKCLDRACRARGIVYDGKNDPMGLPVFQNRSGTWAWPIVASRSGTSLADITDILNCLYIIRHEFERTNRVGASLRLVVSGGAACSGIFDDFGPVNFAPGSQYTILTNSIWPTANMLWQGQAFRYFCGGQRPLVSPDGSRQLSTEGRCFSLDLTWSSTFFLSKVLYKPDISSDHLRAWMSHLLRVLDLNDWLPFGMEVPLAVELLVKGGYGKCLEAAHVGLLGIKPSKRYGPSLVLIDNARLYDSWQCPNSLKTYFKWSADLLTEGGVKFTTLKLDRTPSIEQIDALSPRFHIYCGVCLNEILDCESDRPFMSGGGIVLCRQCQCVWLSLLNCSICTPDMEAHLNVEPVFLAGPDHDTIVVVIQGVATTLSPTMSEPNGRSLMHHVLPHARRRRTYLAVESVASASYDGAQYLSSDSRFSQQYYGDREVPQLSMMGGARPPALYDSIRTHPGRYSEFGPNDNTVTRYNPRQQYRQTNERDRYTPDHTRRGQQDRQHTKWRESAPYDTRNGQQDRQHTRWRESATRL